MKTAAFKIIPVVILFIVPLNCTSVKITSVQTNILKQYRRVAVVPLEISLHMQDSSTMKMFSSLKGLAQKGNKDPLVGLMKSLEGTGEVNTERYLDSIADSLYRNLLDRGFLPVERTRMKEILNEIGFQQTGLVDTEKAVRIGKLSQAEALFIGKLDIHVERGFLSKQIDLRFSGSMVSVSEGLVLLSGEGFLKNAKLSAETISRLIDRWFGRIRRLD